MSFQLNRITKSVLLAGALTALPSASFADAPPPEEFREQIPVEKTEEPVVGEVAGCDDSWIFALGPSVGVSFFKDEDNTVLPGVYANLRNGCVPLNLRVGVEGNNLDSEQAPLRNYVQLWPGNEDAELTYIRIPIALEYVHALGESTNLFAGGGFDILHIDNVVSDTGVGFHLSGRVEQEIVDRVSVGVEGGYMFDFEEMEAPNNLGDLDFSGAFVNASLMFQLF